jgi:hypothetical protein
MGKRAARARLRLHRETVRNLSDRQLAGIAGGTVGALVVLNTVISGNPNTNPRSNLWTGDYNSEGLCNA